MADQKGNSATFEYVALGIILALVTFAIGIEINSIFGSFSLVSFEKTFSCLLFFKHISKPALACDKSIRGKITNNPFLFLTGIITSLIVVITLCYATYEMLLKKKKNGVKAGEHKRELGVKNLRSKAPHIRPNLKFNPKEVGFLVGKTDSGRNTWITWEESLYILGPPRSGKTRGVIIPLIKSIPGAAVVTSIRDDLITSTAEMRSELGEVYVFSQHSDEFFKNNKHLKPLFWDPIVGCEDLNIAKRRADSLVNAGSGLANSTENKFWAITAADIITSYFHAAALAGYKIDNVYQWANNHNSPIPSKILDDYGKSVLADNLRNKASDSKMAANNWAGVLTTLNVLSNTVIRNRLSPQFSNQAIDFTTFIKGKNTIYLTGTESNQEAIAPIIALLIEEIIATTRDIVAETGKRCDPPLSLILDEVANIAKLGSISSLLSTGGGSGIFTALVLQSNNQARNRWGAEEAGTMWEASTVKLILGGLSNANDLRDISLLGGINEDKDKKEPNWSEAKIRGIPQGQALLIHRRLEPMKIKLREIK
jgi:type IV secretory pathway TraG/TraD family ATPase VirD4